MTDLVQWLDAHTDTLVSAAAASITTDAALRDQTVQAMVAFFDALRRAGDSRDPTPLYTLLVDWVESRRLAPMDDSASFVPVLARIKAVTRNHILHNPKQADAVSLYGELDEVLSDALVFLAAVEAEDLMLTSQEQLRRAELQIRKLNKSKSDFIAIAAHELKTPLTIIEGYAGMIRGSEAAEQDEMLLTLSDGIEKGIRRLRELVEDLVDVSIVELDMLKLNFQQTRLPALLDALEKSVADYVAERKQTLVVAREGIPNDPIYADPDRLLQVLVKIVTNGIKYTPDGGTVTVSGQVVPGFVDLTIADTGVGIAASRMTTIFDAFSTGGDVSLHSSGKVKFKGSGPGLGLPIAKGIVEAHGGSIWAQSPGYNEQTCPGSTFHVMLPLRAEPPQQLFTLGMMDGTTS